MSDQDPFEDTQVSIDHEHIQVSGILRRPENPVALLTLAHGAGAGMSHPHLERLSKVLAEQRLATLRYQFPYMEQASKRPDRAPVLEKTVRAAVAKAKNLEPHLPLFTAGRSMGGRMSARAHAANPLPIEGLIYFAFPLHRPANLADPDPTLERAEHLYKIQTPMLFLAGTRDRLARPHLLEQVVAKTHAGTLHMIDTADHSFEPTKKSGRDIHDVEQELAQVARRWIENL